MEDNKYKKFFDYLTTKDIEKISKDAIVSESTIRKYLSNNDVPDTELAKAKLDKIVECAIQILKEKSLTLSQMIENA